MKKNNSKKYLLQMNDYEYSYIKSKAKELGMSIKGLIIISVYGLTNKEEEKTG
jgi:hypothetical protein